MTTTFTAMYSDHQQHRQPDRLAEPVRKTPPSATSSRQVTTIGWSIHVGTNGFSMMCAVASAAESVIVMTKLVAAKPSRQSTSALPRQRGSRSSSTDRLPWPCGLSAAMRW